MSHATFCFRELGTYLNIVLLLMVVRERGYSCWKTHVPDMPQGATLPWQNHHVPRSILPFHGSKKLFDGASPEDMSRSFLVAQRVKDLALSLLWLRLLLWHGFSSWPGNFCTQWSWPKRERQRTSILGWSHLLICKAKHGCVKLFWSSPLGRKNLPE